MRHELDSSARRYGEHGELVLGGSPTRLFRLSVAGSRVLDSLVSTDRSSPGPTAGPTAELVGRLVDSGVLHPVPDGEDAVPDGADVTVVVPVRNRSRELAALLDSINAMTDQVAGIIVVDDGSDDAASIRSAATAGGATVIRRNRSGGPAAARNEGLRRVSTTFTAFVDSDCLVSPDWLRPLLGQLGDPSVAVAAPRVCAGGDDAPRWLRSYEQLHSPLDLGDQPAAVRAGTRVSYVPAAAMVVRTAAVEELGGFDVDLRLGEDVDLIWRLVDRSNRVRYVPDSLVQHRCRPGLLAFVRQRVDYGSSAAALQRRHGRRVAPAVVSEWSVAGWAAVLGGHPLFGLAALTTSALPVRTRLRGVPPAAQAQLVLRGQLGAGAQLATAVRRGWWPFLALVAPWSRIARRALAASVALGAAGAAASAVGAGRTDRRRVAGDAVVSILDDAAYGIGVWKGCVSQRSLGALRPSRPR